LANDLIKILGDVFDACCIALEVLQKVHGLFCAATSVARIELVVRSSSRSRSGPEVIVLPPELRNKPMLLVGGWRHGGSSLFRRVLAGAQADFRIAPPEQKQARGFRGLGSVSHHPMAAVGFDQQLISLGSSKNRSSGPEKASSALRSKQRQPLS